MERLPYRDRDYSFGQKMLTLRIAIGLTPGRACLCAPGFTPRGWRLGGRQQVPEGRAPEGVHCYWS